MYFSLTSLCLKLYTVLSLLAFHILIICYNIRYETSGALGNEHLRCVIQRNMTHLLNSRFQLF